MAAVDDILAAHFREHVHRKKSVNKADRIENTRFKLRVLDLVDIYFRRKSADANMVILLPALLQVSQFFIDTTFDAVMTLRNKFIRSLLVNPILSLAS